MANLAIGEPDEAASPDALRGALAEFISLFLFVFIGLGSVVSYEKLHPAGGLEAGGLLVIAIAHGLAIAVLVAATANLSGGHVNPAVSLGLALAGKITVVRLLLYWVAQLLGAAAGAWVLKTVTTGEDLARHAIGAGVSATSAVVIEAILTFTLVFVVFATAVDPKKGTVGIIAPLAIGFTVLAQIFVGAPFSGASMNPGRSFGPALVALDFTNLWVYFVGPFAGAAVAALVYDGVFLSEAAPAGHEPVPTDF